MPDSLKPYRSYILMFALNLAIVIGVIYLMRRDEPRELIISLPPTRAATAVTLITVQVTGAVLKPGTYELNSGARVADAIERAGGARPEADLSGLNLARPLKQGDTLDIPSRTPKPTTTANPSPTPIPISPTPSNGSPTTAPTSSLAASTPTGQTTPTARKININTATVEELMSLPRIGQALAQRIVEYRTQNGSFKKIDEIKNVRGIGDALFQEIQDLIAVE